MGPESARRGCRSPGAVDQLVEFCRRGPSGAEVTSVEVVEEEPEGLSGFEMG